MEEGADIVTTPEAESSATLRAVGSESVHEFIRYFIASGVALLVDVGALTLLTSLFKVPYLYSGAIAFLLGLIVIYVLSISWVFGRRAFRDWRTEFLVFALVGFVGLGLNELVLWILTGFFGLFYLYSKVASVIVVFTWNFSARKWLLFRNSK